MFKTSGLKGKIILLVLIPVVGLGYFLVDRMIKDLSLLEA